MSNNKAEVLMALDAVMLPLHCFIWILGYRHTSVLLFSIFAVPLTEGCSSLTVISVLSGYVQLVT